MNLLTEAKENPVQEHRAQTNRLEINMSDLQNTTGLIPIREQEGQQAVSGRELHEFLEIGAEYAKWLSRMIEYGFEEGKDFSSILTKTPSGGRPSVDHALTLDMAKELSMIQRTERGKQARQYFIEVEKRFQAGIPALTDEQIVAQALQITTARVEELEAKVQADAPKVEYVDQFVALDDDCRTFRDLAKNLGVGEQALRADLLMRGWIYKKRIGQRFSSKQQRVVTEYEYRAGSEHARKFKLVAQHNAPRHHNNQLRQTLYVTPYGAERIAALIHKAVA